MNGFIDAQLAVGTEKELSSDSSVSRLSNEIYNGAIYFTKTLENLTGFIDLPFELVGHRSRQISTNDSSGNTLQVQTLLTSIRDSGALSKGRPYETGLRLSYNDQIRVSLGGLMHKKRDMHLVETAANTAASKTETYVNASLGTKLGHLDIDLQYSLN